MPHKGRRKATSLNRSETSSSDDSDATPNAEPDAETTKQYDDEIAEQEEEQIRFTNAYPGATNSIGSIHQRRWFLSMDRRASGFEAVTGEDGVKRWVRVEDDVGGEEESEGFVVRGRDLERSVLTGRNADDVLQDEGVEGFVGRRGWKAIVE